MWGKIPGDVKWWPGKNLTLPAGKEFLLTKSETQRRISRNVGGVNWGSAAYDPQHHLMFANTNRLIAWVKLVPRAKYDAETNTSQDNRIYGEFGKQQGAASLYRHFPLFSGRQSLQYPAMGTTAAVDLFTCKIVWNVPLGSYVPGQQTAPSTLADRWSPPEGSSSPAPQWTIHSRIRFESGKEVWNYELPAGGQATP